MERLLVIALFGSTVNCARILAVIGVASFSHQVFFRQLWRAYLERGHELTLITTDPMLAEDHHVNFQQLDMSIVYDTLEDYVAESIRLRHNKFSEARFLFESVLYASRRQLSHPEVQSLFSNRSIHFDLLLIEDMAEAMYAFKERFDVPCIALTSLDALPWTHAVFGNPTHPILYAETPIPTEDFLSGLLARFMTVFFTLCMRIYHETTLIPMMDQMISEVLPGEFPSIRELRTRVDMLFTNANPLFSIVRPYSPNTISLAGAFHMNHSQIMTEELQSFLDSSPEGVVYFSLGTNIKAKFLSPQLLQTLVETFRQLPFKVLWKVELDLKMAQPQNVRLMNWCPQQAVLKHKNMRAFISQGGVQSLEEAVLSGVPILVMPFIWDQEANARRVVANGMGLKVDFEDLTVSKFKAAIMEVVENAKYANNVKRQAELIMDRRVKPLEDAIWWSEYLLRHKDSKHLKITSIPFYQYYYLDLLLLLFIIILILTGILFYALKIIVCLLKPLQALKHYGVSKVKLQ